ncbi:MAG: tyrosine-type recombinase/integrase [Bacillota bacterium]|uniref:tyrosine-type recombinase/integrase n=1 Tax=Cytobacillus sp. SAFR-174 TaxID=3436868 RepID=UPI003F244443
MDNNGILIDSVYYRRWHNHSNLADSTKKGYEYHLKRFERFLLMSGMEAPLDFNKFYFNPVDNTFQPIDEVIIDEYILALKESGCSKGVLYQTIEVLRSFFSFLANYDMIESNVMSSYPNPYYERKLLNRALSYNQCLNLLNGAKKKDPFSKHYYLLLMVLLTCGLRANEIIHLRKEHINLESKVIYVEKGQKTKAASVHFPESVRNIFIHFFNHPKWLIWEKSGNHEVFFEDNQKLNHGSLQKIIDSIALKSKIKKKITAHQFRHTMATLMFESGIELSLISRQLRHRKLYTTLLYVCPNLQLGDDIERFTSQNKYFP